MPSEFELASQRVTAEFLQTVLIVDDRAFDPPPRSQSGRDFHGEEGSEPALDAPGRARYAQAPPESNEPSDQDFASTPDLGDAPGVDAASSGEVEDDPAQDEAHELNARALVRALAKDGIYCAVVQPEPSDFGGLGDELVNLAQRADIVMLDWVLNPGRGRRGEETLKIIRQLGKVGSAEGGRLCLIFLYTGETTVRNIIDQVSATLAEIPGTQSVTRIDPFTVQRGSLRVTAYVKHTPMTARSSVRARVLQEEELPERLIREFSRMNMGLVPHLVLKSLAVVRSNTHRILATMHKGLDAPYLAHQALLPHPDTAADHLVQLAGAEINSILHEFEVDETVNPEMVQKWIDGRLADDGNAFRTLFKPGTEARDAMHELITKGVKVAKGSLQDDVAGGKGYRRITSRVCQTGEDGEALDHEFALLTSVRTQYGSRSPHLALGTIIREDRQEGGMLQSDYWLCVQPRCHSVRLSGPRKFPFVHLQVVGDGKFDLVVPSGDKDYPYVRLGIDLRPFESMMKSFTPTPGRGGSVYAKKSDDLFMFTDDDGGEYRFVAELRFEQAQRIANDYGSEFASVGLDESEWLRRWSGSGDN